MNEPTASRLADDIARSLETEPQRWREDPLYALIERNDGLQVWKDASGVHQPRNIRFGPADRVVVERAIAAWESGPLQGEPQEDTHQ